MVLVTLCVQLMPGTAGGRIELMVGANLSILPQFSDTHLTAAEMGFKGKNAKKQFLS